MRYYAYILSAALSVALMAGCSKHESVQQVGSSLRGTVPEGWFVATFSTSATRAGADFNPVTGEDSRVADLRYLLYDADGNFVKEKLIFDNFDANTDDDTQDWPLPSITDTLIEGRYTAVFITNTNPGLFRRPAGNMTLPDDLLTDYKLGFDRARINLPCLLGADDYDFFMDVIRFSHEDPSETVYLQRILGIFKVYRSLVDIQEGLDYLVADLVDNIKEGDIIENQITPVLSGTLGDFLSPVTGLLGVFDLDGIIIDPIVEAIVDPVVTALYELLLKDLTSDIGGFLEGNNESDDWTDLLDPLLNPWYFAEGAAVTVSNQPTRLGFDMEVKSRDPDPHTYYLPIVDAVTDGENKKVVITKYLGFEDIGNDGTGEELMTLESIDAAISELVEGVLLDHLVESDYLLPGTLFDIEDPLDFCAPGNLQLYNEYSLVDLGVDDYSQTGESLTLGLTLRDVINSDAALGGTLGAVIGGLLNTIEVPRLGFPPWQSLGDFLDANNLNLLDMQISLPVNLPLLDLDNLDVSGGWDPANTVDMPD